MVARDVRGQRPRMRVSEAVGMALPSLRQILAHQQHFIESVVGDGTPTANRVFSSGVGNSIGGEEATKTGDFP
jgi:hypothetical protein